MRPSRAMAALHLQPFLVMFLGAPGAGKGTQSSLLAERFGFLRVETSRLLEERFQQASPGEKVEASGATYDLDEQRERWETGLLVADAVVADAMKLKLAGLAGEAKTVLLDGFPRTLEQMEHLLPFVREHYKERLLVLYLDIDKEDALFRNSHRRICSLMRHPILYLPETESLKVCPIDGSDLVTRTLDDPEVIAVRLQTFHELTLPLLSYFEERGARVVRLSGKGSVAEVFARVSGAAEALL